MSVTFFWPQFWGQKWLRQFYGGNQSIYLDRSGPLLEDGLDRPKNRYGRYGFPSFYSIFLVFTAISYLP